MARAVKLKKAKERCLVDADKGEIENGGHLQECRSQQQHLYIKIKMHRLGDLFGEAFDVGLYLCENRIRLHVSAIEMNPSDGTPPPRTTVSPHSRRPGLASLGHASVHTQ